MQERQDTGSDAAFTGASSNNQLVAAANPLLNAIPQIRHSVSHDDQVALRQRNSVAPASRAASARKSAQSCISTV